jgi:gliding motility-associated-like protein
MFSDTNFNVTQDIEQPVAAITGNEDLTCVTESIVLDASGSTVQGTVSYLWSPGGATTATIDVSEPGEYSVTVSGSDNGCSDTTTIEVIQDITAPTADAGEDKELTCTITSIQLDGAGSSANADANLTYAWSGPDSFSSALATPEVSAAGTYILTVTDTDNGCEASDEVVVSEDITAPTADAGEDKVITCTVTSIQLDGAGSSENADANLTYAWSGPDSFSSAIATPEVSAAGTYTLTVTDTDNGCEASDEVVITQDNNPPTASIDAPLTELTCEIISVTLDATVSTGDGILTYEWSTGATTSTIDVGSPGDYSVTVSNGATGCSDTASITVTQNITAVDVSVTGNEELSCLVASIFLDASGTSVQGTASYLWSTGATTSSIEVETPGQYSVTVTDSATGCAGSSGNITVTLDDTPLELDGGTLNICVTEPAVNLTTILLSDYVPGGTWTDDNNSGALSGNMFDPGSVDFNPALVDFIDLQFTYTEPGECGRIITVYVNVNDDCVSYPCETPEGIEISKVVTANNDGYNDVFEISDLEPCGYSADVQIFNRWGKVVYHSSNYQNNWDGYDNGGALTIGSNNKLPTGTYYYVITIVGSGYQPRTGYIYLGTQ